MDTTGWLVCNAFLQKLGDKKRDALLSYLPSAERDFVQHLHTPKEDLSLGLSAENIAEIHPSWWAPFLRTLPENDIRFFVSALPTSHISMLKKTLLFSGPIIELSSMGIQYAQTVLFKAIAPTDFDLLSSSAVPASSLNQLLTLSFEEISLLIELLGVHDLAVEVRQIIDTVQLKKIQSCLSREKAYFLQTLSHKKERIVFRRMDLEKWDGDPQTLLNLLYSRGVNRLAKALFGENESFLWHIEHRLSTEQAGLLALWRKELDHPKAKDILSGQIVEILALINKWKAL